MGIGLIALLVCPTAWAVTPVIGKGSGLLPAAGPSLLESSAFDPMQRMQMDPASMDRLTGFLRRQRQGERYLLMSSDLQVAASIIIPTGEPVAALGGFLGSDPILTPERFAQMVAQRQVRYLLISPMDTVRSGPNVSILEWVQTHGVRVPDKLWKPEGTSGTNRLMIGSLPISGMPGGMTGMMRLYDCMPSQRGETHGTLQRTLWTKPRVAPPLRAFSQGRFWRRPGRLPSSSRD